MEAYREDCTNILTGMIKSFPLGSCIPERECGPSTHPHSSEKQRKNEIIRLKYSDSAVRPDVFSCHSEDWRPAGKQGHVRGVQSKVPSSPTVPCCAFASVVGPCQIVFTFLKDVSPLEAWE